jgi:alpha-glucosidase
VKQAGKTLVFAAAFAGTWLAAFAAESTLKSPDGRIVFKVDAEGRPSYSVSFDGREAIGRSALGFAFADEAPMADGFEQLGEAVLRNGLVESWKPVVRNRHADVRLSYNSLKLAMREKTGERRKMDLEVRAFDGGVAFRYTLYGARVLGERIVTDELTEFRVPATSFAWVGHNAGGSFAGSQESRFKKTPVREIRSDEWCLAPFLVEVDRSTYVALLDAYLDNYPGRCFAWRDGAIVTRLVPSPREGEKGAKARFDCRFDTPWRVILVGDNPGRFIESEIVQALNPPCAIEDTSWIRPGMSAWDHWWSGGVKMEMPVVKEYIDFAAKQGWPYMLVDWQWYGPFNKPEADITRTAPQIDMPELLAYAKERGVRLWLWLYSSDVTRNDAFEEAFALYAKWGVAGVKIDFMDRHDREIVNWYRRIAAAAAKNRLMLNFHGAYAPDGIERTYPNLMTREGVQGEEYSKFSLDITPDHNVTLAFTRMLAGPMDYTPGGFLNVAASDFKMQSPTLVMNTRAAELAKFVVYESPWMCFCDHPRNVLGQPGSEFVAEVPTVWDDTRFLGGYPGEWVAVARRSGDKWYLGVLNGNEAREVELDAPFLSGEGRCRYWSDGEKPTDVVRGEERVPATRGKIRLAAGGGFAAVWEAEGK